MLLRGEKFHVKQRRCSTSTLRVETFLLLLCDIDLLYVEAAPKGFYSG